MAKETRSHDLERRVGEMFHELEQKHEALRLQSQELRQQSLEQFTRSEARFDELNQLIRAISLQNQARTAPEATSSAAHGDGEESNLNGMRNEWGKSTRLEFPKFEGTGLDGWLMRADYFFEVAEVPMAERVKIAALHLEGKALQWHRGHMSLRGDGAYADWRGYVQAIAARFGSNAFEDPLADLRNLKQVSSLQEYMDMFDELYPRTGIREDQALSFFLSGLIDELQMPVRMFKPQTLADVYALAKLQELTVAAMHNKPKPRFTTSQYQSSTSSYTRPITVTTANSKTPHVSVSKETVLPNPVPRSSPRITNKEIDEQRAKEL